MNEKWDLNLSDLKTIFQFKPNKTNAEKIFDLLNKNVFFGMCPKFDKIKMVEVDGWYGQVSYQNGWLLEINSKYNKKLSVFIGTMAHEMIHRIQAKLGRPLVENDELFSAFSNIFKRMRINIR